MLFVVFLVTSLVVMAGFIAYAGDVLGTTIGRRRLSLFGWRPKRTGQIIGVAVGILIMLVTLGTLMLANRGAAGVLISAQETYLELRELQRSVADLQAQIAERTEELEQAKQIIQDAQRAQAAAFAARDAALAERDELEQEISDLQAQISGLQEEIANAAIQLDEAKSLQSEAEAELEAAQIELAEVQSELDEVRSERTTAITLASQARTQALQAQKELREAEAQYAEAVAALDVARGQSDLLTSRIAQLTNDAEQLGRENRALSSTNESLSQNNELLDEQNEQLKRDMEASLAERERLSTELALLTEQLQEQEVALSEAQRVISSPLAYRTNEIVHRGTISAQAPAEIQEQLGILLQEANRKAQRRLAGGVTLSSDQFASLQEAIMETPGEDVVVLYSPTNQVSYAPDEPQGAEPLQVKIEVFENTRLLDAGQLVVSRQMFVGSPVAPVSARDLMTEINGITLEAANKLQRLGLFEGERPQRAPDTLSEEGLASQLSRLTGSVEVALVTRDPIYRGGPALLEFVILH